MTFKKGLSTIIQALTAIRKQSGVLVLCNTERVNSLLDLGRLINVFTRLESEEEALRYFA